MANEDPKDIATTDKAYQAAVEAVSAKSTAPDGEANASVKTPKVNAPKAQAGSAKPAAKVSAASVAAKPVANKPAVGKPLLKASAAAVPKPVPAPPVPTPVAAEKKPAPVETKPVPAEPKPAAVEARPVVAKATDLAKIEKPQAAKSAVEPKPAAPVAKAKPVEKAVPVKVAAPEPVVEAPRVTSAVPAPPPAAATPKVAETASKPAFAGLFANFTLEDTKMDMSTNFTGFQDAVSEAQAKAKEVFEKSTKVFGEVGDFTKGNVEAVIESGKILADGVQSLGSELVSESRSAFEVLTGDIKELAAAKSPTDYFKIQSDVLRKNFDSAVAYGSKNSEAMLKLVSDAIAPISGRVSIAVEKARSTAL